MKITQHVLLFGLIISRSLLCAQSNEGTEFWFGYMQHRDVGQNTMVVMVTSKYNTQGTIRIPLHNYQQTFPISANSVSILTLPSYVENTQSEIIQTTGIQVVTERPSSVYIHQYHMSRSEATLILPVSALGHRYYTMSYAGYDQGAVYPSEFLLLGLEDSTLIQLTVSDWTKGNKAPGSTTQILLQPGQTYLVQARSGSGDLSGSLIEGNKKFNVLSGCTWTGVPVGCSFRDNLLEQMWPIPTWGKQFISAPFAEMPYDLFRILASEDQTFVTVTEKSSTTNYTLNKGEYIEYQASAPTKIVASHPIMVAQYLIGSMCSGYWVGDPSMILLNSISQIRDTVTLYNSRFEAVVENYINLIAKTVDLPYITFDGQPLLSKSPKVWPVDADTSFSTVTLSVQEGPHTIISEGCGVIASAYGYGNVESYAYGGGASFSAIDAENLIPEGGCLTDSLHFYTNLSQSRFQFIWDLGDGFIESRAEFYHKYAQVGRYKVQLILFDQCLNTRDTFAREVRISLRQAAAVQGDSGACIGATLQLSATDIPGASYKWTGPNGFLSLEQNPVLDNINASTGGSYAVVGTVSGCESYPAYAQVVVFPSPEPFLGRDTVVCPETSGIPLLVLQPGSYQAYAWQDQSRGANFSVVEAGNYQVTVEDEHGCKGSDEVTVRTICPTKYYIPNIFSPNNDGFNDDFGIDGTDIRTLDFRVYDRWGDLLFETQHPDKRWDGNYRGKPVTPGVYVWKARIGGYRSDGSTYDTVEQGSVTVIR
ncbi:MAG: gliding motility-associated C-terminal domain-containing protein [Bacteroidetes bacterium]|nr:gliding motility-associated C-terminal domain-containing protein [Bacteroidota bacterium]